MWMDFVFCSYVIIIRSLSCHFTFTFPWLSKHLKIYVIQENPVLILFRKIQEFINLCSAENKYYGLQFYGYVRIEKKKLLKFH